MKSVLFTAVLAASMFTAPAFAETAAELAEKAKAEFAQREYDNSGLHKAKAAAELYQQAVKASANDLEKARNLVGYAEAMYFVGESTEVNADKITIHDAGMKAADEATKILGIPNVAKAEKAKMAELKGSLSAEQLQVLGDALYQRGIHLGQWGQANGVTQSLSKWPELRNNMEILAPLSLESIHNYGGHRVLGRGYFKIPGLLGGSMKKATEYLSTAVKKTYFPGSKFSVNGTNNIYYAEVLYENGDIEAAKTLLKAFIAADATKVAPSQTPEFKRAQRDAAEILKNW